MPTTDLHDALERLADADDITALLTEHSNPLINLSRIILLSDRLMKMTDEELGTLLYQTHGDWTGNQLRVLLRHTADRLFRASGGPLPATTTETDA